MIQPVRNVRFALSRLLLIVLTGCGAIEVSEQPAFSGESLGTSRFIEHIDNETTNTVHRMTEVSSQFYGYDSSIDGHYAFDVTKDSKLHPSEGVLSIEPPCIYLYQALTAESAILGSWRHRAALSMPLNFLRYDPVVRAVSVADSDPVSDGTYSQIWATDYPTYSEQEAQGIHADCRAVEYLNVKILRELEPLNNIVSKKVVDLLHGYYAAWGNDSIAKSHEGTIHIEPPCIFLYETFVPGSVVESSIRGSWRHRAALRMPLNLLRYDPSARTVAVEDGDPVSDGSYSLVWGTGYSGSAEQEGVGILEDCKSAKYLTVESLKNVEPLSGIVSVRVPENSSPDLSFFYSAPAATDSNTDERYTPYPSAVSTVTLDTHYQEATDLEELMNSSDIVFVGRIIGYKHGLRRSPTMYALHSSDAALPSEYNSLLRVDVYDGVTFEIEEIIAGDLPLEQRQATLIVQSLIENHRSDFTYRVHEPSWEVIESGVAAHLHPDGPRYLVYATDSRNSDPPYFFPWHYVFTTQGGVAPLMKDGRIGAAAVGPLAAPGHGLTLDDVRAAAAGPEG